MTGATPRKLELYILSTLRDSFLLFLASVEVSLFLILSVLISSYPLIILTSLL